MTTVGETRVLPEDLATTYSKLRPVLAARGKKSTKGTNNREEEKDLP